MPYTGTVIRRVVIHIGPPKTGTTTLQSSLYRNRDTLRAMGIRYVGSGTQSSAAAMAVTRRRNRINGHLVDMSAWRRLVDEVRRSTEPTIVISSEWFAAASPEQIKRISQLSPGADYLIVVTVRPLDQILPSRWRQNVIEGATYSYAEWLELIFSKSDNPYGDRFWHQHRHDKLIRRWAEVFGPEAIAVICAEVVDSGRLLRHFETLIGANEGVLGSQLSVRNRSLDAVTVEAVRRYNLLAKEAGVSPELGYLAVTRGAVPQIEHRAQSDGLGGGRVPVQFADRCLSESRSIVQGLRASRAKILGNLDGLVADVSRLNLSEQTIGEEEERRSTILTQALYGQLRALGLVRSNAEDDGNFFPGVMDGFGSREKSTAQSQAKQVAAAIRAAHLGISTLVYLVVNLLNLAIHELLRRTVRRLRGRS